MHVLANEQGRPEDELMLGYDPDEYEYYSEDAKEPAGECEDQEPGRS